MKVLIAVTTYDGKEYILERFVERLKELTYENFEIIFVDNSKDDKYMEKIKSFGFNCLKSSWNQQSKIRLTNAQNIARNYFLEGDYTHFFSLEQDLLPPKDVIEQLLKHDKDVVGGWYYITDNPRPCLSREWKLVDMQFSLPSPLLIDMAKEKLMKVFLGSFGCCIIKRKVLEKIKFKVFQRFIHHSDTWFYNDCELNGIDVYVDTSLLVPHFQDYRWNEILSKDREIEEESLKLKLSEGLI